MTLYRVVVSRLVCEHDNEHIDRGRAVNQSHPLNCWFMTLTKTVPNITANEAWRE